MESITRWRLGRHEVQVEVEARPVTNGGPAYVAEALWVDRPGQLSRIVGADGRKVLEGYPGDTAQEGLNSMLRMLEKAFGVTAAAVEDFSGDESWVINGKAKRLPQVVPSRTGRFDIVVQVAHAPHPVTPELPYTALVLDIYDAKTGERWGQESPQHAEAAQTADQVIAQTVEAVYLLLEKPQA